MFVTDSGEPRQPAYRLFGIALGALLLVSLALLTSAIVSAARGDVDAYPNQHLRAIAGGLTHIFLAGFLLAAWRARFRRLTVPAILFLTSAVCALAWRVLLSRP